MTPADIPSLVAEATRYRDDNFSRTQSPAGYDLLTRIVALLEALSPKEAELVKPPREYEVSGDAVVIQADRDAAAECYSLSSFDPVFPTMLRDGRGDTERLVQFFARHRLAAEARSHDGEWEAMRERSKEDE